MGIRVVHIPHHRRWEHIWAVRMLFVLLDQQLYRFGGDHDLSNRILRFGWADHHLPCLGTERFDHRDRPFLDVQILPQPVSYTHLLSKKLIDVDTEDFYCLLCMAEYFGCDEDELKIKIREFKEQGCTLFL